MGEGITDIDAGGIEPVDFEKIIDRLFRPASQPQDDPDVFDDFKVLRNKSLKSTKRLKGPGMFPGAVAIKGQSLE